MTSRKGLSNSLLLVVGILFIAINLRGPITSVGSVLSFIIEDLHLSATQAGMITTLPLIAFAFFSPVISGLAKKSRLEFLLMAALVFLAVGLTIRSIGNTTALFFGSLIIGLAITAGNVLLPSLLKRDLSKYLTTITAMYVLSMGIGSAMSASVAVPIVELTNKMHFSLFSGWAWALWSNILLVLLAIFIWLPQIQKSRKPAVIETRDEGHYGKLWSTPSAWYITVFLGINSFMTYSMVSWLPTIAVDNGFSEHYAGLMQGVCQLGTGLPGLVLIPIMAANKDMRLLAISMSGLVFISLLGFLMFPAYSIVWSLLFGFSVGGAFIVALSLIGLRSQSPGQATALSGMAQSLGYTFAAFGPAVIGKVYEVTSGWDMPLLICLVICAIWIAFAPLAAKNEVITTTSQAAVLESNS